MIAFCSYGTAAWIPTYFVRVHGWSIGQVGLVFGLIVMIFGSMGIVTGGRLSDRWTALADTDLDTPGRDRAASYVRAFVEHHLDRRLRGYDMVPR